VCILDYPHAYASTPHDRPAYHISFELPSFISSKDMNGDSKHKNRGDLVMVNQGYRQCRRLIKHIQKFQYTVCSHDETILCRFQDFASFTCIFGTPPTFATHG